MLTIIQRTGLVIGALIPIIGEPIYNCQKITRRRRRNGMPKLWKISKIVICHLPALQSDVRMMITMKSGMGRLTQREQS
jgi:hypothetical protein